jgi:Hermansky-Pudlak syndrome 4 protein
MQKLALCGQLMGLLNFCSDFANPDVLSLENGTFKIHRFGRFIFSIGTDRNIQESLLNCRSELMVNILRLYHRDIENIFSQFDEPKNFSDKLYHIFETFLPLLTYNGNLLQNV